MRTILILMDSLNRHYLPPYGNGWVQAPNIRRLAERGVTFDNHFCGSMPCMPARRDLFNGRYNFLETPWGPLEPYDEALPRELRSQRKVYSHLITDHYHYWEWMGMGYHTPFNTWEFVRGQEGDHWHPRVKDPAVPPYRGKNRRQDWINRRQMDLERDEDYPTPQCFQRGIDFLEHNHDADNWFLQLEVFDPHEPFLTPSKYREIYEDTWDRDYLFDWPPYARVDPEKDGPEAVQHIRRQYAATLTRADHWLGRFLEAMDRHEMWDDTTVILTTDHGHLLGEHGYWAKNYMFDYLELTRIPLIVAGPGTEAGARREALTSTIDLMPTVLDLHGGKPSDRAHGRNIRPLLAADGPGHDSVLYGYFAKDINWTDGRHTYCRQPLPDTACDHHTAMATHAIIPAHHDLWANAECDHFLPDCFMPVYRVSVPCRPAVDAPDFNPIHDIQADPAQESPIRDEALEAELAGKLMQKLTGLNAPPCQFERAGLK